MARLTRANLGDPAHQRQIGRGIGTMNPIGPLVVGRAQLEPGWRWSIDLAPIVGTASCMVHTLGEHQLKGLPAPLELFRVTAP